MHFISVRYHRPDIFQWRIQDFPDGGANSKGECQPIAWSNFSRKLHENKRNWTKKGRVPRTLRPEDPKMDLLIVKNLIVCRTRNFANECLKCLMPSQYDLPFNFKDFMYNKSLVVQCKKSSVALTFTVRCESRPPSYVRPQRAVALPLVRAAKSVAVITQKHRLLPIHVCVLSVKQ